MQKREGVSSQPAVQFRTNRRPQGERRQSSVPRLQESGHASTSYLDGVCSHLDPPMGWKGLTLEQAGNRFSHPAQARPYQGPDSVVSHVTVRPCPGTVSILPPQNIFGVSWPRAASSPYDRQLNQRYLPHPPPPSLPPNRKTQQRRSSRGVHEDNLESAHRLSPPSPTSNTERFAQGRSNRSSAAIEPRDDLNVPINHPHAGSTPRLSAHKLCGLTRRPRVQGPSKRVSRVQGDVTTGSVDPETSQVTEMGYSVMSVRHSDPDGSGSSFRTRFALPPTSTRPIPIGRPGGEVRPLGASPLLHVEHETGRPRSRIKAREGAGSAFANTHSIPKKEPHTLAIPSLMDHVEGEWLSLSPVSTPKAPPLDQHSVIRDDPRQEVERPIAGCRTDPRISFVTVKDRNSLDFPLEVSHAQSHAAPANNGNGRNQPGQQSLFQELYHLLEPPAHLGSDALRSKAETSRDGKSWEPSGRPGCAFEEESDTDAPRGPEMSEQALHVDVLLAQRVARDAMQEDGECEGFPYQSSMLSASECGEEAVEDSSSDWSECGLDRKHSTRSVFDWGYA